MARVSAQTLDGKHKLDYISHSSSYLSVVIIAAERLTADGAKDVTPVNVGKEHGVWTISVW